PGNPSATAGTGAGTTGGTGGTGSTTGGSTGTGAKPGTMLTPANYYTVLSDADAPAATTAAPAKWGTYCGLCHGPNAQGISGLGTELRHVDATMATWVVRNGRNAMSKYSTTDVSDAELTEILTWLNALPKPTTPTGLYRDFCGTCHGPTTPSGGAVAIAIDGLPATGVSAAIRSGEGADPAVRAAYMPKFDATKLTDAEIAQINTFLGSK
ncbi:MAG TPA: cytochrome c, partial [Polyangiaceae bacterium]|nr:cytochrome c [Polyangiaceae bacterium]